MKCLKCQFDNPEDSVFCLECGNKMEFRCPQCDNLLPIDAKFCNKCGISLKKSSEVFPVNYSEPQSYTPNISRHSVCKSG